VLGAGVTAKEKAFPAAPTFEPFQLSSFLCILHAALNIARCTNELFLRRRSQEATSIQMLNRLYLEEEGQDVAEYAIMLAVILVIVMGVVRMIGSNASIVFSQVASGIQ
jgi:Flp pilus assembly pilin Flp